MPKKRIDDGVKFDHASAFNTLALLGAIATSVIAYLHPFGDRGQLSPVFAAAWIFAQSVLLVSCGWLLGRIGIRLRRRWIASLGIAGVIAVPTIVLCDAIVFGWTRQRFLSADTFGVVAELRSGLWRHAAVGTIRGGLLLTVGWSGAVAALLVFARFVTRRKIVVRDTRLIGLALVCYATASAVMLRSDQTLTQMRECSSRHPLCVFRVLGPGDGGFDTELPGHQRLIDDGLRVAVTARANQQRRVHVVAAPVRTPPDVLVVVVESFRRELVCEEVMPHLWSFARRGIHCRQHFSGGNATNHGMFSLVNGLEAIWYDSDVRFTPLLNRLMREAGYELGFFAGHDDWRLFQMDGYISPEQFDVFEISQPNGLQSDRLATQRAANFLDRVDLRGGDGPHRPRFAVLYLYATHADYHSYPEDQVFEPAADDRFLIPFTGASRDRVWNRYKNSARSVDRFLSAVMRDDRVVLVTGDHGESFLEDGVCGHGVRISKFQNMTPAVLYRPGGGWREMNVPTMHADLLPTLLSTLEIAVSDGASFDGVNLGAIDETSLRDRAFTTRNYLNDDVAVIVSSESVDDRVYGYRGRFSIRDATAVPLNPIDESGQPIRQDPDQTRKWWHQWLTARFKMR